MSLKRRLKELEKQRMKKEKVHWLVYERNPEVPEEELKKAAIAKFKAQHPDWPGNEFNFIVVCYEQARQLTEWLLGGEEHLCAEQL